MSDFAGPLERPLPPPLPVLRDESTGAPARESSTGRAFPCPKCGARLDFDPARRALRCEYCNHTEPIDPDAREVLERDWEEYWQHAEEHTATIAGRSSEVRCKVCAAVVLLEDKVVIDKCPYCGNDLENKPVSAENMILPEGILPFKVELTKAKQAFNDWVGQQWFAPNDLKQFANLGKLNGVYVPFWTYDALTFTRYSGLRGDNYQEMQTFIAHETFSQVDASGRTVMATRPVERTQMVTKTRWTPASGNVEHAFDDVLVCASQSIPHALVYELGPWDLQHLETFKPEFLAGFQTERYTVDLGHGFEMARAIMDRQIHMLCCQDMGGDQQQLQSVHTQHAAITFKHILQPVWLAPYRYHDKLFRIAINARTGEVVGERPYSTWKIALLVLMILALVAGMAVMFRS